MQENLTGVRIVRAYTQEAEQARQFDVYNEEYRRKNMSLVLSAGAFHPVLMLISGIALVLATWLGALEVVAGRMTKGDFVAYGFYLVMLIWPMIALGWVVNLYQRGAASMGRLNKILAVKPAVEVPREPASLAHVSGRIEFRNVSFTYPDTDRVVLDAISFVVEPGATVAIVGPTGSGKSTLVALLARQYDPTDGEILFDGVKLTDVDPAELRLRIGMVPQDPFLFSATIADNIGLGLDSAEPLVTESGEPCDVIAAATGIAQLAEQIEGFPNGYGTMLGERGINLSGGQKQRTTLVGRLTRLQPSRSGSRSRPG